jgi:hypothetical protein
MMHGGVYLLRKEGDSPARYYYIQRAILEAMYKDPKKYSKTVDFVFLVRQVPSPNEGSETPPASLPDTANATPPESPPPEDIHPLKKERTIVIHHCLVTGANPSEDEFEYLPGELKGGGHDQYFQEYYNDVSKAPRGNMKRWVYRYNNGQSKIILTKNCSHFLKPNGFSENMEFVMDKRKV